MLRSTATVVGGEVAAFTFTFTLAHVVLPHALSHRQKYVVLAVGLAMTSDVPVPMLALPHEPANHRSVVPLPAVALSVILPASSEQKLLRFTLASVGGEGAAFTLTATLAHSEFPHRFSHRQKYCVLAAGLAITIDVPVPMLVLPHASANHRSVAPLPPPPDAVSVMLPESSEQKLLRSTVTLVAAAGVVLMATTTVPHTALLTLSLVRRARAK